MVEVVEISVVVEDEISSMGLLFLNLDWRKEFLILARSLVPVNNDPGRDFLNLLDKNLSNSSCNSSPSPRALDISFNWSSLSSRNVDLKGNLGLEAGLKRFGLIKGDRGSSSTSFSITLMSLSPSSDSAVVDCNVVVVVLAVVGGSRSLTLDRSLLIIELFLLSSVLNKFGLLSLLLRPEVMDGTCFSSFFSSDIIAFKTVFIISSSDPAISGDNSLSFTAI